MKPARQLAIKTTVTIPLVWEGIILRLRYTYKHRRQRHYWTPDPTGDLIEVRVIGPNADLCPQIGSRIEIGTRTLRMQGGPAAVIRRRLDAAARDPSWRKVETKRRQLSLFPALPSRTRPYA
ncbi:MAG: hypothetical protein ABL901_01575 [Hyphomicrobiaceae bacterium]